MYKTFAALGVVLSLVLTGLVKLNAIDPRPVGNSVLAEKSDKAMGGGQAAMILPTNLTVSQAQVLNTAYVIARADGHKNPEIVQEMVLQETRAGGMEKFKVAGNKGDEYYGVAQIKLSAAKDVLSEHPDLWHKYDFHTRTDDEIKAQLIMNPTFNIEIGSKYLKWLQDHYGFTGRRLLNAYNRGPGGVQKVNSSTFHYAIGAEQKLAMWKEKR